MSSEPPSTSGAAAGGKRKVKKKEEAPRQPREPFKPSRMGLVDAQIADYVRSATAKNVWYYR